MVSKVSARAASYRGTAGKGRGNDRAGPRFPRLAGLGSDRYIPAMTDDAADPGATSGSFPDLPGAGPLDVIEPLRRAIGERYLTYALSTIMNRALPDARDGLKPVHRRILFAMRELRLSPGGPSASPPRSRAT